MKMAVVLSCITISLVAQLGCGVKSKPLPPLKEPWISTGELEKDREKKAKQKKSPNPSETRVEFAPSSTTTQEKER